MRIMDINQAQEPDYESVKIDYVGFVDPYAVEGMVVLKADNGKEFHMRAFSGEVAKHISSFGDDNGEEAAPSIYKMIEDICEENELILVKVKIYESGEVLRANLYFTGKKDLVLRNYRASDAMALAAYYNIPILVRKTLLKESMEAET
ncbi:Bifunctional nuclease protein [Marine Group I thaumarchaeote SCGC AAA799-P11]|uniref:Bifunctional nuclease protein n=1 Tax=Marine Group I thaumarchaeote SCGC AAA799-P11 TaxID=1502295 RepID=A0A087RXS1_9ARCH|nr:Bifunctional nuclease protein [Marine Group I thaumarchaeote SCGC AAA799-P11]